MDKIINLGFHENFIQGLADRVEKEFIAKGADLGRLAFVFGGRRPELFLKRELAKRIKKGFVSPAFFSMDDFIDFILARGHGFSKINDLEAAYVLYCSACEKSPQVLKGKDSFSSFLPWAREILAFIEQLDLEDIELKSLKSVELNAAIGFDVPESINALLANVISLRRDFHRVLKDRKTFTRGMRYLFASGQADKLELPGFDKIIFCNPFYLHTSEKKIISGLYKKERAVLVFQGDSENFSVLKDLEKEFDCEIKPSSPKTAQYKLSLYSCFDSQSQAGTVRQILKGIKDPGETVIVLPNQQNIIGLLSEISVEADDFNVSMGYPLKRTPLFSLFKAVFRAQNSRKNGQYYSPDYLAVLTHPLVKNFKIFPDPTSIRMLSHKIEELLVGLEKSELGGAIYVSLDQIESLRELYEKTALLLERAEKPLSNDQLRKALLSLHELMFYSWESVSNFRDFAKTLSFFVDFLLKKSFLANYPLNLKIAQRIIEISAELEDSGFSREKFSREEIFKIFMDSLENEMVSFSGSPLKGLQILGLIETRSLNFKNVIIMDVNESILPDLKIYEPLIPREVMLNLGLNRLEKEEEIQRYQFDRLISHAENVFLLFEEGRDKERSRFIEGLVWNKQKKETQLKIIPIPRASFKVEVFPKKEEVKKTSGMIDYLEKFDYSVTNINTYLKCPLRFYYRYVLNLEEKIDLLEEPEGRQIGNFIHSLLEDAFRKFIGKKPVIDRDFKKYFFGLFEEKFNDSFLRTMKSDSFLLKEIIRFRMERFLEEEKNRQVAQILMLEEKFREKVSLADREYNFVLKVDRIDLLADNSMLILDYKTGGSENKPKSIEKIKEYGFQRSALKNTIGSFQMPIYLYFVRRRQTGKPLINAAIYNLRLSQIEYFLKSGDFSAIEEIDQVFIQALASIISEIVNPQVNFSHDDQDQRYCQNCPFFYLCR
jgi:ATP-dependent helicase/nuclease subunit B